MSKHRIVLVAALAVALGLALSTGILLVGGHDDVAALRANAIAALELKEGDCVASANPLRATVDLAALRKNAEILGGRPGRVDGVFFGKATDLAADLSSTIASSGASTVWVLTRDLASGQRAVTQYDKVDLGSDGTAWLQGGSVRTISCEEAGS